MPASVPKHRVDLVITGAAELLTCAADASDLIGRIRGGGVAVDGGTITAVGDVSGFSGRREIDATGKVVLPGFVDSHTHVVFGGDRALEYAAKVAGQVPPSGASVGIVGTMADTRAQSVDELVQSAAGRIKEMISSGTTTLESKTGYGLDTATEERLLEVNARLAALLPARIMSTYLGAHAIDPQRDGAAWTEDILAQLTEVGREGSAAFNDVYCDTGYFSLEQSRKILEQGQRHGLRPKIHLDAYSHTGAAELAAAVGAVSADHLNYTTDDELRALAKAGVTGVYMPCLEFAVQHPAPLDPRRLYAAGMEVALATDVCPGSWTTSMHLAVAMGCRIGGMTVAQALRAATYGGACALGLSATIGSLVPGMGADIQVLDVPFYEHIAYRPGRNSTQTVIINGSIVKGAGVE
ncbi:imidazolonepropionase [Paenarthrobacter sp. PH39-S1]|uniref:imidazolonepropionase n=1 Tax=Paenarthrobacter sp. PH39-S1 TaxID=3046204 RepID=UPI0024B9D156|nr:imidazolonepropionase [Paenarthrobacter sp. PH39-S1]MDJ0357099.1 imidazolonepropionase [Paenarthrobacter sp. PH39-S1]